MAPPSNRPTKPRASLSRDQVLRHIRKLWGYDVRLREMAADADDRSG